MSNKKYSMDLVLDILRDDQNKGILVDEDYLIGLAKRSGWLAKSLEIMLAIDLHEGHGEPPAERQDNVAEYYARRELEDRDSSRSASGYNSSGDPVELDFN